MFFLRPGSPRTSVMKLEDDEVKSFGHEMSALNRENVNILNGSSGIEHQKTLQDTLQKAG